MQHPGKPSTPTRFLAPRGTHDILPQDSPYWNLVRDTARRVAALHGYSEIETPIFEDAQLFLRGAGQGTDVADKEMYIFRDRGDDLLALRPEGTANICRAYLEHGMQNLPQPVRLFYIAPNFRYDRPQAGRYRQHWQFGVEAIGDGDALVDAEVIGLLKSLYDELGLKNVSLQLNSIGDSACRPAYIGALHAYYFDKLDSICPDCRVRYERNPLRLLDCKEPQCQPIIARAPTIEAHLCADCAAHFGALKRYLDALGIAYTVNHRLVRGLDYYTRTVFEFQPAEEGGQSTVGGGGRYDALMEVLGGPPTPGIGFGTGIERIVLNLQRQGINEPPLPHPDVYIAHLGDEPRAEALALASQLRREGISSVVGGAGRSLKSQMRHADSLGARYAIVIGSQEIASGTAVLRRMSDSSQESVPRPLIAQRIKQDLAAWHRRSFTMSEGLGSSAQDRITKMTPISAVGVLAVSGPCIVPESASVRHVAGEMWRCRSVRTTAVVDASGRLCGIIPQRSLVEVLYFRVVPEEFISDALDAETLGEAKRLTRSDCARDLMQAPVFVRLDETVGDTFTRIRENDLDGLPVVDEDMRPVGYIDSFELLAAWLRQHPSTQASEDA